MFLSPTIFTLTSFIFYVAASFWQNKCAWWRQRTHTHTFCGCQHIHSIQSGVFVYFYHLLYRALTITIARCPLYNAKWKLTPNDVCILWSINFATENTHMIVIEEQMKYLWESHKMCIRWKLMPQIKSGTKSKRMKKKLGHTNKTAFIFTATNAPNVIRLSEFERWIPLRISYAWGSICPAVFFFWLSFCSCVPVVSALQFSDSPFYLRNKLLTLFFPRSLDRIWFIWLQRIYRMEFTDSFSLERAAESKKWKKKLRIVRTPNAMWKFTIEINKLAYSFSNGNQLG